MGVTIMKIENNFKVIMPYDETLTKHVRCCKISTVDNTDGNYIVTYETRNLARRAGNIGQCVDHKNTF